MYLRTLRPARIAPKIPLRVDDNPLPIGEHLLEQRIARGERDAVVATFHHKVDLVKQRSHLRQTRCMMAKIVGSREGVEDRKGGARDESGHVGVTRLDLYPVPSYCARASLDLFAML